MTEPEIVSLTEGESLSVDKSDACEYVHIRIHAKKRERTVRTQYVQAAELDLRVGPETTLVVIELDSGAHGKVCLRDTSATCQIQVKSSRSSNGERGNLELRSNEASHINIVGADVDLAGIVDILRPAAVVVESAQLQDGTLTSQRVEIKLLELSGQIALNDRRGRVLDVTIHGRADLITTEDCPRLVRVHSAHLSTPTEGEPAPRAELRVRGGQALKCEEVVGLNVRVDEGATLSVATLRLVELTGPGRVEVQQGRSVALQMPAIRLSLAPYGQLVDVWGALHLVSGRHGHVSAKKQGAAGERLEVLSVDAKDRALEGISLTGIHIPPNLSGRETIAVLRDQAEYVTPAVTNDLPGRGPLRGIRNLFGWLAPEPDPINATMDTEYSAALADLAQQKGAPASVRTALAWSSYRMRNITAPSWAERFLLSVYRLIGYGERPAPAFIAYIAAAALVTAVIWGDTQLVLDDSEGYKNVGKTFGYWLATPLHVLNLTGQEESIGAIGTLGRLVVAVPFVTAVLATRNYLKNTYR